MPTETDTAFALTPQHRAAESLSRSRLTDVLRELRSAPTPHALEARFRATFDVWRSARTEKRIRDAVHARGLELCERLDTQGVIPRYVRRSRRLTVCGETVVVGRGHNGAGVRYVWAFADEWVRQTLQRHRCPALLHRDILSWWKIYPHRALRAVLRHHRRLAA